MLMLCLIFNFSSVGHCCILNLDFCVVKLVIIKLVVGKLTVMNEAI